MRKAEELRNDNTCLKTAHPSEMVFVLLSRDYAAPVAIRAWVEERIRLGKNVRTDAQILEALAVADTMEGEGRSWVDAPRHYPLGMGEASRRLHRQYKILEAAQRAGAKNGADVARLVDECGELGIVLVPGGENL